MHLCHDIKCFNDSEHDCHDSDCHLHETAKLNSRRYAALLDVVIKYDAAARKFINKVESGNAISTVTYNELKAALEASEKLKA